VTFRDHANTEPAHRLRRQAAQRAAVQLDAAITHRQVAGDCHHQRRFARTVCAEQADDLATLDVK
jgi:hypothetical protein